MQRSTTLALAILLIVALTGCGAAATATVAPTTAPSAAPSRAAGASAAASAAPASAAASTAATPAGTPAASGPLKKLTLGLGYIPDIQFAPFYVAKERGYFREEGLDVEFRQGFETDVLKLLGTGALNFGVVGGDELMIARSQGVPIVYVATWFQKYPITVVALEGSNIRSAADLKGRTVGVPGRFGATYVGLRALLDSAGLKESDVQIREIGFTQVQALTQKQVDAVVGYANNEPVQLRALGQAITTINVYDTIDLVANGLVTDEKTLKENPELVRSVARAMVRGVQDVVAKPDEAVTLCIPYIPGSAEKRAQLRAVLDATIPLFQSQTTAQQGYGYSNPASWQSSAALLRKLGFLGSDIDVARSFSNEYLPPK
jgi:NitT/TauT family transport system substrate-binding protein